MFRIASSNVWALLMLVVALGSSAQAAEPIPARVWSDLASDDPAMRANAVAALEATGPGAVAFLRERLKPVAADVRRIDALIEQLDSPRFAQRRQATEELEYLGKIAHPQLKKALASKPLLEVRRRIEPLLKHDQPRVVERSGLEDMVRGRYPKRTGPTPFSDILRDNPEVALNPGLKIMFRTPGGVEMTPRQVIEAARGEQASGLPVMPSELDIARIEAALEKAHGQRQAVQPVSLTWTRAVAAIRVLERVDNTEARELLQMIAGGAVDALPTVEARSALKRLKANAKP
jgi:hypothetical protein